MLTTLNEMSIARRHSNLNKLNLDSFIDYCNNNNIVIGVKKDQEIKHVLPMDWNYLGTFIVNSELFQKFITRRDLLINYLNSIVKTKNVKYLLDDNFYSRIKSLIETEELTRIEFLSRVFDFYHEVRWHNQNQGLKLDRINKNSIIELAGYNNVLGLGRINIDSEFELVARDPDSKLIYFLSLEDILRTINKRYFYHITVANYRNIDFYEPNHFYYYWFSIFHCIVRENTFHLTNLTMLSDSEYEEIKSKLKVVYKSMESKYSEERSNEYSTEDITLKLPVSTPETTNGVLMEVRLNSEQTRTGTESFVIVDFVSFFGKIQ